MGMIEEADAFADVKHRGQFRRDGKTPYVEHPRAVCRILRDEFGVTDPRVLAAGLLHDTIEDTTTDFDDLESRFGRRVASLVAVLTKDKRLPERRREQVYFDRLAKAPAAAALCKLADTLHNCRDADGSKRPKALGKARRLLRILPASSRLLAARELLRKEISR